MSSKKPIMVVATATGFLGCLREKGGPAFDIGSEDAFAPSWMERVEGDLAVQAASAPAATLTYTIKHVPAGNWTVVDSDGNRASRVFKKDEGIPKELAQQEAVRLNAGGQPVLEALPTSTAPVLAGAGPAPAEGNQEDIDDPTLPDA